MIFIIGLMGLAMTEELKPCPFCGGEKVTLKSDKEGYTHFCCCDYCGAEGSAKWYKELSIKCWNTRANCQEKIDSSSGNKMSPVAEKKLIDPREHPLTKEMVGKVALVDGNGNHKLLDWWKENTLENVRGEYTDKGRYQESCESEDDIKYYYWI